MGESVGTPQLGIISESSRFGRLSLAVPPLFLWIALTDQTILQLNPPNHARPRSGGLKVSFPCLPAPPLNPTPSPNAPVVSQQAAPLPPPIEVRRALPAKPRPPLDLTPPGCESAAIGVLGGSCMQLPSRADAEREVDPFL
jgi:hypothetical protein